MVLDPVNAGDPKHVGNYLHSRTMMFLGFRRKPCLEA